MDRLGELKIRQLDETLGHFRSVRSLPPPGEGWAKTIREALGMSARQLAKRAQLSKTSVRSVEANEAKGSVQLNSLRTLAEAMDCELVYAFVPRGSLSEILEDRAEQLAQELVDRVSESMELEAQGVKSIERTRQVKELKTELLRNQGRDFWDD